MVSPPAIETGLRPRSGGHARFGVDIFFNVSQMGTPVNQETEPISSAYAGVNLIYSVCRILFFVVSF